jgi:predicted nuclease with TOPRIM domain
MVLSKHSFKDLDVHINLNHYTKIKRITIIKLMENKTITMPLIEYQNWEINNKFNLDEVKELRKQIEDLQTAKAVFIERMVRYDRYGNSKIDTLRPRIFGKGVELNKAIQALRDDVDKIHVAYSELEAKMRVEQDLKIKQAMYTAELDIELDLIKSKWWYKLFNYGK